MRSFIKRKSVRSKLKSAWALRRSNSSNTVGHAPTELDGEIGDEDDCLDRSRVHFAAFLDEESTDEKSIVEEAVEAFRRGSAEVENGSDDESNDNMKGRSKSFGEDSNVSTERLIEWAGSFRRADPRVKIEKFFNLVAQEGGDIAHNAKDVTLRNISTDLCFEKASVFTVWRPTSLDAIRRMMLGEGVGKGLDIKGKSAKTGILSAFVPFLQIHEEKHKKMVQTLHREARMRIFYTQRGARDTAVAVMRFVSSEMVHGIKEAQHVLNDPKYANSSSLSAELALERSMCWDMADPTVKALDEFASHSCFGIEVPMRLFWEAYVMRQDVTREQGSPYETGRPSEPAFQDMNFSSLKNKRQSEGDALPVVWQHESSNDDPMCPLSLLMAYEENGRVLPVVSDFDCFLAGSKRVRFGEPLPDEQLSLVKWSVSKIEKVLDSQTTDIDWFSLTWTKCWLKVLQEAASKGFHPKMPKFGYGDPRSYSIMEQAVGRLQEDGCVRHGAECFNYYFPQELDEQFLVIGKATPGNVPWCYMDAKELQKFLGERIDEGYTFPLNPKWILCDPGWKEIYDKLLASEDTNVQNSMAVWYPKASGIREQIEATHTRHPDGFVKPRRRVSFCVVNKSDEESFMEDENDGTAAMDLAELELKRYLAKQRAILKLRAGFTFNSFSKKKSRARLKLQAFRALSKNKITIEEKSD